MDAYWNEDGFYEYGSFSNAVSHFRQFETQSEAEALLIDLRSLRGADAFSRSSDGIPRYEEILGRQFSSEVSDQDVVSVLSDEE